MADSQKDNEVLFIYRRKNSPRTEENLSRLSPQSRQAHKIMKLRHRFPQFNRHLRGLQSNLATLSREVTGLLAAKQVEPGQSGVSDPLLECPICTEAYSAPSNRPMILTLCGHTICKQCLDNLLRISSYPTQWEGRIASCPLCKLHFSERSAKVNFALEEAIEKHGALVGYNLDQLKETLDAMVTSFKSLEEVETETEEEIEVITIED